MTQLTMDGASTGEDAAPGQREALAASPSVATATCKGCPTPLRGKQRTWCSDACRFQAWDKKHPRQGRARQAAMPGESAVERAFNEWIRTADGKRVEDEVVRRARRLIDRGKRHYGIAALVESIRYDFSVNLLGDSDGYRINNNHRSLLARRVMQTYPDLAGFFDVRDLRGRAA